MQHIIKQQRLNYYGSVPLISETHFVDNLNKAFADKHEAFLSLRRAQESENESALLKNQLHKHISILDELKSDTNANNKILQWYQEKKNLQLQVINNILLIIKLQVEILHKKFITKKIFFRSYDIKDTQNLKIINYNRH